jgi:APA family basic amino acid/polyamine antiporter
VLGGAGVVFFAYIGFDIVATTAEETRNPQSDMPVGIIGSLAIVTVLYVLVAAVITGMVPFGELAGETPVAEAFAAVDMPVVTIIVFAGALLALFKTTLLLMLGQTRVAFAMARDRLLPP